MIVECTTQKPMLVCTHADQVLIDQNQIKRHFKNLSIPESDIFFISNYTERNQAIKIETNTTVYRILNDIIMRCKVACQ